jgi:predicted TIM-barrel fold metal-dependent hydrolase
MKFKALALILVGACCGCAETVKTPVAPAVSGWHLGEWVIDSHVHVHPSMVAAARLIEVFDKVGIGRFVVKSAGTVDSPKYQATLAMRRVLGDRMQVFANLDWEDVEGPGHFERQVQALEQMARDRVRGIKIFKNLGLSVRTRDGHLLEVDDLRLAPLFDACARLGLIVAWHVADPVAFFQPPIPQNERYAELSIAESWSFYGGDFPSHRHLMDAMVRVIERHPKTTFLLIHMGNFAEDMDFVDRLLERHPNVYTDTSARVPEFGRHDAAQVRRLFEKHQDRILFGSDLVVNMDGTMQLGSVWHVPGQEPGVRDAEVFFERHWHYFETTAQQIEHPTPIQGRWKVDAIGLPPAVLRKLYVTNAERLLFRPAAEEPASAAAPR